jgi:hypothetical protein
MKTASRFPDHLPVDIVAGRNQEVNTESELHVMRMLRITGLICMLLCMAHQIAQAQTEWKDNYITLAEDDQTNPAIARPSQSAYTIVVWEDNRDTSTYHTDIYALRIDNKTGLPQWEPPDGVPVCTAGGDQSNPRAAYDSLGYVIIVWEDYRGDSSKASIYAQCLSVSDGSVHRSWLDDGNAVCDTTAHAERPRVVGSTDGAFVSWVDWRNSPSTSLDSAYRDIYLQYVVSGSAGWPQSAGFSWRSGGLLVPSNNVHDDRNVELARDYYWAQAADRKDRDGVVLVYESQRDTSETMGDSIYVVMSDRFDADGSRTWGDIRCATNQEEQLYPQLVVLGRDHGTGDSVSVIVWQDKREDPDPPVAYDIYGQQLCKHNGNVMGTAAGDTICDQATTQRYPELSLYEREENTSLSITYLARVICVWEDDRNAGSQGIDIYAAVLNGVSGALVNASGHTGEAICTRAGDQTQVRVDNLGNDEDSYIVWRDGAAEGTDDGDIWYQGMDLLMQSFHETGGTGLAVTEAKGDQCNPQVGGNVFAWADKRRQAILYDDQNDWNIYAETPGECVGPKDMNWRDMWADVHPAGDASHMRFAVDSAFNVFVVWEELGQEEGYQDVYIQKLDKTGVPRWQNSGIKLNTNNYASHPEVTISDSTGGAQVTWQQTTSATDSVYYAKISPMGEIDGRMVDAEVGKPVIDYAKFTIGSPGAASVYPAYIGVIPDADKVRVYSWNPGITDWVIRESATQIDYVDIILDATESGDIFLAGWEEPQTSGQLQVVWGTTGSGNPLDEGHVHYDFFGGCDISADLTGQTASGHAGGFVVYSAQLTAPDPVELYAHIIDSDTTALTTAHQLTSTLPFDGGPTQPVMCQDSSINATGYSGMLVAWDLQYRDPYGQQRHQVTTNKFEYIGFGGVNLIRWSNPVDITVSQSMPNRMEPDIARLPNTTPVFHTLGIVVWEGLTEECTPARPKEIVAEWVKYDSAAVDRGTQWGSEKAVGPGPGGYTQTHPLVKNSEGNGVSVFWCDGRSGADMVIGTRFEVDDADMIWLKPSRERPVEDTWTMRLGANYPNPLSLRRSVLSHLEVELSNASDISLKLYDNLGRQMAVVYEGRLSEGLHTLRFDAATLAPGMYHYVLRGAGALCTRGLVIVR